MATTYDTLKAESKRLRALADKIDAVAAELQNESGPSAQPAPHPTLPGVGEYAGMKQAQAIMHALRTHGPRTTTQLFTMLNAGGLPFKKVSYVTAILARFKEKWERTDDGKISLKQNA